MALRARARTHETGAMPVISQDSLPPTRIARELVGRDHGAGVCLIFVDAPPGDGPGLHKHPYEEVFVIQEGRCTFHVGDDEFDAGAGEIVVAPADVPHRFANTGEGPLRQIDIHVSPHFVTEWLSG